MTGLEGQAEEGHTADVPEGKAKCNGNGISPSNVDKNGANNKQPKKTSKTWKSPTAKPQKTKNAAKETKPRVSPSCSRGSRGGKGRKQARGRGRGGGRGRDCGTVSDIEAELTSLATAGNSGDPLMQIDATSTMEVVPDKRTRGQRKKKKKPAEALDCDVLESEDVVGMLSDSSVDEYRPPKSASADENSTSECEGTPKKVAKRRRRKSSGSSQNTPKNKARKRSISKTKKVTEGCGASDENALNSDGITPKKKARKRSISKRKKETEGCAGFTNTMNSDAVTSFMMPGFSDMPCFTEDTTLSPPSASSKRGRRRKRGRYKKRNTHKQELSFEMDEDEEEYYSLEEEEGKDEGEDMDAPSKKQKHGSPYSVTGTRYIANGYLQDLSELLNVFECQDGWRFKDFALCWQKQKFSLIYRGRQNFKELLEFSEEIASLTKRFLGNPHRLKLRIGALYTLYGLYYKHPFRHFYKIRIIMREYENMMALVEQFRTDVHNPDPAYIFRRLKVDGAFLHVATLDEMCLDLFSPEHELVNRMYESHRLLHASPITAALPQHLLQEDDAILQHYHSIKAQTMGDGKEPERGMSLLQQNLVKDVSQSMQRLHTNTVDLFSLPDNLHTRQHPMAAPVTTPLHKPAGDDLTLEIGARRAEIRAKATTINKVDEYIMSRHFGQLKNVNSPNKKQSPGQPPQLKAVKCEIVKEAVADESQVVNESQANNASSSTSRAEAAECSPTEKRTSVMQDKKVRTFMCIPSEETLNTALRPNIKRKEMGGKKGLSVVEPVDNNRETEDEQNVDDPLHVSDEAIFIVDGASDPEASDMEDVTTSHVNVSSEETENDFSDVPLIAMPPKKKRMRNRRAVLVEALQLPPKSTTTTAKNTSVFPSPVVINTRSPRKKLREELPMLPRTSPEVPLKRSLPHLRLVEAIRREATESCNTDTLFLHVSFTFKNSDLCIKRVCKVNKNALEIIQNNYKKFEALKKKLALLLPPEFSNQEYQENLIISIDSYSRGPGTGEKTIHKFLPPQRSQQQEPQSLPSGCDGSPARSPFTKEQQQQEMSLLNPSTTPTTTKTLVVPIQIGGVTRYIPTSSVSSGPSLHMKNMSSKVAVNMRTVKVVISPPGTSIAPTTRVKVAAPVLSDNDKVGTSNVGKSNDATQEVLTETRETKCNIDISCAHDSSLQLPDKLQLQKPENITINPPVSNKVDLLPLDPSSCHKEVFTREDQAGSVLANKQGEFLTEIASEVIEQDNDPDYVDVDGESSVDNGSPKPSCSYSPSVSNYASSDFQLISNNNPTTEQVVLSELHPPHQSTKNIVLYPQYKQEQANYSLAGNMGKTVCYTNTYPASYAPGDIFPTASNSSSGVSPPAPFVHQQNLSTTINELSTTPRQGYPLGNLSVPSSAEVLGNSNCYSGNTTEWSVSQHSHTPQQISMVQLQPTVSSSQPVPSAPTLQSIAISPPVPSAIGQVVPMSQTCVPQYKKTGCSYIRIVVNGTPLLVPVSTQLLAGVAPTTSTPGASCKPDPITPAKDLAGVTPTTSTPSASYKPDPITPTKDLAGVTPTTSTPCKHAPVTPTKDLQTHTIDPDLQCKQKITGTPELMEDLKNSDNVVQDKISSSDVVSTSLSSTPESESLSSRKVEEKQTLPKHITDLSEELPQASPSRSMPVCSFLYSKKYKNLSKIKEFSGLATGTVVKANKSRVPFILKQSLFRRKNY